MIIVLGKGTLAIRVAQYFREQDRLTGVMPVQPEPAWDKSLISWAKKAGVPVVEPSTDCIGWSAFYHKIIDPKIFKKAYNIHNAPLPKYRGMSPINWALKNGEKTHGVTIHEIDPGIDSGAIISQVIYDIYPTDEVRDVYWRALEFAWTLFQQTEPLIDKITPRPQTGEFTYYSKKQNADLGDRLSWTREESMKQTEQADKK